MDTLILIMQAGTLFIFGTMGEVLSQRSGVLNLGLEGMMVVGSLAGFAAATLSGNPWIGLAAAMIAGGLMSLIHGFIVITLRQSQVVSGMALTIFGLGLTAYVGKHFLMVGAPPRMPTIVYGVTPLLFLGLALVPLTWFVLYRTRFGLTIRAVGEDPEAADTAGINVARVRYICVFIGGMMAGLAGAYLSLAYSPMWREGMTAGRGWICIALAFFSMWRPTMVLIGAELFGGLWILQFKLQGMDIPVISRVFASPYLLMMITYLVTVLIVTLVMSNEKLRKRIGGPAALGVPYERSS